MLVLMLALLTCSNESQIREVCGDGVFLRIQCWAFASWRHFQEQILCALSLNGRWVCLGASSASWESRAKKPPSEAAIRKFLAKIDPVEVDELVGAWLMAQAHNTEAIAIDGKTLRGTKGSELKQCHLLSAVLHVQGLTIAQTKVEDKTNEITAIKPLLNEIDIEGSIVTLDALHTQKETARYLTEEKRADYLMTVKDNQRGLKEWKSRNANDSRRGEHRWSRLSKCRSNLSN
jgi:hypothetical protein